MKATAVSMKVCALASSLFMVSALSLAACGGKAGDVVATSASYMAAEDMATVDTPIWVALHEDIRFEPKENVENPVPASITKVNYDYDECGDVLKKTVEGEGYEDITSYSYDKYGWETGFTLVLESGNSTDYTVKNTLDDANRLVSTTNYEGTTEYSYDANGNVACYTLKNGDDKDDVSSQVVVIFNEDGTPQSVKSGTEAIQEFSYEYDEQGRASKSICTQYMLDGSGNKLDAGATAITINYVYDENGNVSRKEVETDYGTVVYEYEYMRVDRPSLGASIRNHMKLD